MAARLLKAERDRVLAADGGSAVEVHLTMDSQNCLWSGCPDRGKKPHCRKRIISQRKTRKSGKWIPANTCISICKKRTVKSTHTLRRQNPPSPWAVSLFCPWVGLTGTAGSGDTTLLSEMWYNSQAGISRSERLADSS